ncbi:MAG TPA: YciI family protein [Vineibacter sp.]|nr:YciI family protein [Vineibacter sp.]
MAFCIQCFYRPGGADERFAVRTRHLAHMAAALPRTIAGGQLLDDNGAAIGMFVVLDVPSRRDAEAFMATEPYNVAGLFATVSIVAARIMTPEPTPGFLQAELARQQQADRAG